MTSGQVDLQNGSKGTFPGVLWQDQTSGGQIVDYEKCVYVFTLANAVDHAAANKMCESSLVQPTSGRVLKLFWWQSKELSLFSVLKPSLSLSRL